jgi:hypothetical protein
MTLAMGESTSGVARQFNLSSARISQLREELKTSWERFHERGSIKREEPVRMAR